MAATAGVTGQMGWAYYLVQGSTAAILLLAANTSFADFPRLASLMARILNPLADPVLSENPLKSARSPVDCRNRNGLDSGRSVAGILNFCIGCVP